MSKLELSNTQIKGINIQKLKRITHQKIVLEKTVGHACELIASGSNTFR